LDDLLGSATAVDVEGGKPLKRAPGSNIILVPQPSDSPDDPLVSLMNFQPALTALLAKSQASS
jgi:hypothetical protein